ncbi:unnamed protein product, partial [Laminaria digitata]
MRRFHLLKNREHCPIVNLDKLWSMLPAGTLDQAQTAGGKAPVVDVTDQVIYKEGVFHSGLLFLVGARFVFSAGPGVGRRRHRPPTRYRLGVSELKFLGCFFLVGGRDFFSA